jgi:esterase/lipase superfamily enzyme
MQRPRSIGLLALAPCLVVAVVAGCTTKLAETPTIMVGEAGRAEYAKLTKEQQTSTLDVLYFTDRERECVGPRGPEYGYGRSRTIAFGTATVGFNPQMSWDELVEVSTTAEREREYIVELRSVAQYGQFSRLAPWLAVVDDRFEVQAQFKKNVEVEEARFRRLVSARLAAAAAKDVYVYVHGFNNSFEEAIFRLGMVWHLGGRPGVPIAYTWPAGMGGPLGYFYDRESGDFTIPHLKRFLRSLAAVPGIERLHLVAHSRGCEVLSTAIRELNIDSLARGKELRDEFHIETVVLAAPDFDCDVFSERFASENLVATAKRTVIYFSPDDSALSLASFLFSRNRVGTLQKEDFDPEILALLAKLPTLEFIDCKVSGGYSSHTYVFDDPAVLSDLTSLLRDHKAAGAENGRPLRAPEDGIWLLDESYLRPRVPAKKKAPVDPQE